MRKYVISNMSTCSFYFHASARSGYVREPTAGAPEQRRPTERGQRAARHEGDCALMCTAPTLPGSTAFISTS